MGDFVAKDPRGYTVVLSATTWTHAEPHHEALAGKWRVVIGVLTKPDLILDNPQRPGLARKAAERYCGYSNELKAYVVIPVRLVEEPEKAVGGATVPAGSRSAVTVFTSDAIPSGGTIWRAT